jgi:hypothetical protein
MMPTVSVGLGLGGEISVANHASALPVRVADESDDRSTSRHFYEQLSRDVHPAAGG